MGYRDKSAKEGFHEPRQSCQQQWVKLGSWLGISMVKVALFSSQGMKNSLALGLAATLAVFAVAGLHTKTDTEFAGILMLALAVGVLVALGVWL